MSENRELEIQRQFLDEAQEYLSTLEDALLGLASSRIDTQKINAALRAAHSIKGGAAMMGFQILSDLAHRLEDSFKVLKTQKQSVKVDSELEHLLLSGVDCLRYVISCDREACLKNNASFAALSPEWVELQAMPIFKQLHDRLGDPQSEDAASVLSPEDGQDILPLIFETEVEGCLQRLEAVLNNPEQPCLQEEVAILAQELGGLGEMLQLAAFTSLCESVTRALELPGADIAKVAQISLKAWRRSQALVLSRQLDLLPTAIEGAPPASAESGIAVSEVATQPVSEPLSPEPEVVQEPEDVDFSVSIEADWAAIIAKAEPIETQVQPAHHEPQTVGHTVEPQPAASFVTESRVTDFKVLPDTSTPDVVEEDPDATVRVPVKQLNQLNDLFGELTIERNALDLYLKRLRSLTQTLNQRVQKLDHSNDQMRTAYDRATTGRARDFGLPIIDLKTDSQYSNLEFKPQGLIADLQSDLQSFHSEMDHSVPNGFDALEMDQYNELHLLSQQLMETIVQIQEVTSDIELSLDDTEQTTRNLNKTAKQLQKSLTHLRMRPLSDVVDRFPRALRELCLQHGKQARLNIVGGNTLIDRNILEALNDPLMHLLRNAFDHGIEDPETRIANSKSPEGVIEIQAFHRGNRTIITLSDDGGGIPIEKIRVKAERMGLDATLLAAASDQELLSLIFEPGFSTTDQVTALSGRGVGMDVVRDSLKQIRGEIKVDTQAGVGTTFTLSVPFTLSVVRVLLVETNGMLLAFPADVVNEIVTLKPEDVITTAGNVAFAWDDAIVQLVVLSRWFEFRCPRQPYSLESPPNINEPTVLMVAQGDELVGMQIDRCWGEQEVAIRRVEGNIPMPHGFTNCTIMGDGRVVPLVNVPELLHWIASCERSPSPSPTPAPTPASTQYTLTPSNNSLATQFTLNPATFTPSLPQTPAPKSTIMVVDDSINVRRFLALTLEKAGYQVEQAKDGQDALEKLQGGLNVQAVICDIEMPRLDGYGFLAKVKANPSYEHLPITMLTSRSGDKHRQLAMSLGATAYFSKPYNEQVLLKSLEQSIKQAIAV